MINNIEMFVLNREIFFLTAGRGNAARGKTTRHIGL